MTASVATFDRIAHSLPPAHARFLTLLRYELLSSVRRRKVFVMGLVAFALVAIQVFLPGILAVADGRTIPADPDYAVSVGRGFGSDIFSTPLILVFAIAVAMDVIPLEFETGSIATLLAKPVTRGMVFLSKWCGVVLVLGLIYATLFLLMLAGASAVYGAQDHLHLYPALAAGAFLSILVYAAIVFAIGAVSRSSMISAVVGFGGVFALVIASFALSAAGHPLVALHMPGPGPTGSVVEPGAALSPVGGPGAQDPSAFRQPDRINPGTHNIGPTLVYAARNPGKEVVFTKQEFGPPGSGPTGTFEQPEEVLREPIAATAGRAVLLAFGYIAILLGVAWAGFYRAEVLG